MTGNRAFGRSIASSMMTENQSCRGGFTHFEVVVQLPKSCGVTVTFPWQGRPDA